MELDALRKENEQLRTQLAEAQLKLKAADQRQDVLSRELAAVAQRDADYATSKAKSPSVRSDLEGFQHTVGAGVHSWKGKSTIRQSWTVPDLEIKDDV